jgi:hypothetical protein
MRVRVLLLLGFLAGAWGLLRAQRPFQEFPGTYDDFPLPPDYKEPHEWVWGRLRYGTPGFGGRFAFRGRWTTDYPRSDRHLLQGVRRLSRIDTRSVEQVVDMDSTDDIYNWPFLYAVEVGAWGFTDSQASQLRDFLDRGGFLMVDDFHGSYQWEVFQEGLEMVFPDRPVIDLENSHPIFHTIYDLDERWQVPNIGLARSGGRTWEQDGVEPRWRAVLDEKGRVLVAICHNMDLGDAWEWSDDPAYPERTASLAYRIALNYIIYDLTH